MIKHTLGYQPPVTKHVKVNVILNDGSRLIGRLADTLDWSQEDKYVGGKIMEYELHPAAPVAPPLPPGSVPLPRTVEHIDLLETVRDLLVDANAGKDLPQAPRIQFDCHLGLIGRLRSAVEAYDNEPLWTTPDGTVITRKMDAEFKEWLEAQKVRPA